MGSDMKNPDGSINEELCPSCRKFDRVMNGGPASSDVWVVCRHSQDNIRADEPEIPKNEKLKEEFGSTDSVGAICGRIYNPLDDFAAGSS